MLRHLRKIFKSGAGSLGIFEENHIRKIKFVMFKRDGAVVEDSPFYPADFRGGTGMPRLWNGNADVAIWIKEILDTRNRRSGS